MREQKTRSNENLLAKVVSVLRARHRMWMPSQRRGPAIHTNQVVSSSTWRRRFESPVTTPPTLAAAADMVTANGVCSCQS